MALASAAGVVALSGVVAFVVDEVSGSSPGQTDAAVWAPATSAAAISAGPTSADSPSTAATGSPQSPTTPRPSSTMSRPSATRSDAAPAGTEICRLSQHGGTYYLYVTGDATQSFGACAGATPYVGTIGQLLSSAPGMDRRCVLDPDHNGHSHNDATVAVYSDRMRQNLTAANAYCDANGGDGRD